jgi:hypothetical protein
MANRKTSPRPDGAVDLAGERHLGSHSLIFDDDEVIQLLKAAVEREGNQDAFARRYRINRSYLNMFARKKTCVWQNCSEGSWSSESLCPLNETLPAALVSRSLARHSPAAFVVRCVLGRRTFAVCGDLGSARASYTASLWIDQVSAATSRAGNSRCAISPPLLRSCFYATISFRSVFFRSHPAFPPGAMYSSKQE